MTFIEFNGKKCSIQEAAERAQRSLDEGQLQTAIDIYDRVLAKDPSYVQVYNNRGGALHALKRYEDALINYDHAIGVKGDYALLHYNRGHVLQALKRYDDALASYDEAIILKPDYAAAYHTKGVVLMNKGRLAEAENMFRRAFELNPRFSETLYSLTTIRRYRDVNDPFVGQIRTALGNTTNSTHDVEMLSFALGKIYDDCGYYDQAFEYYRRGNRLRNGNVIYNAHRVEEITRNTRVVFTPKFLSNRSAFGSDDEAPVFIVGMPRSGTTLMGSILSNHPSIETAGELMTIAESAAQLPKLTGKNLPYPQVLRHMSPDIASHVIGKYQRKLRENVDRNSIYVIDKYPLNFRYLGFIAILFPRSHIIHCTRHPLDTCLSTFFQRFPLDYDYSFDMQNIAHSYGEYLKIMDHWRKVLPMKLIDVRYEDMVADTEQTARRALGFLGLDWDARCLAPHTNPCAVETASNWQVRQPVYEYAVGRWRHYEKHLARLKGLIGIE